MKTDDSRPANKVNKCIGSIWISVTWHSSSGQDFWEWLLPWSYSQASGSPSPADWWEKTRSSCNKCTVCLGSKMPNMLWPEWHATHSASTLFACSRTIPLFVFGHLNHHRHGMIFPLSNKLSVTSNEVGFAFAGRNLNGVVDHWMGQFEWIS